MRLSIIEIEFKALLNKANVDEQNPNPTIAWEVFKSFANKPFKSAKDALLVDFGVFNLKSKSSFHFLFSRLFTFIDNKGEYDGMTQIYCLFSCPISDQLLNLQGKFLSDDFDSVNEFFTIVENSCEFQLVISQPFMHFKVIYEGL